MRRLELDGGCVGSAMARWIRMGMGPGRLVDPAGSGATRHRRRRRRRIPAPSYTIHMSGEDGGLGAWRRRGGGGERVGRRRRRGGGGVEASGGGGGVEAAAWRPPGVEAAVRGRGGGGSDGRAGEAQAAWRRQSGGLGAWRRR
ncbi:hypothetical protein GUJ93_ZPchr0013g36699 [Zizania palustris]|uniref:Uncharacterized protein n=1 Tax=Zizania palustris TaxID=103762 RepID=A0A8J5X9I1_ZIZPA|nr:hypothetical protein GUJ93_ZPchr0013g36699 [Zizania palustris]